jgi:hypothetical protein
MKDPIVEKAAKAFLLAWQGQTKVDSGLRENMTAAIEAIMPQVDSVEALEALPVGTKLLGADGSVWTRGATVFWYGTRDDYLHGVQILANHGPLRVIWTPKAAA